MTFDAEMTGGRGIGVGEEVGETVAVGKILVGVFVVAGFVVLGEPQADIIVMPIKKIIPFDFFIIFSPRCRCQNFDVNPNCAFTLALSRRERRLVRDIQTSEVLLISCQLSCWHS